MAYWEEIFRAKIRGTDLDEVKFFIRYNSKDACLNTYHFPTGVLRCSDYRRRKIGQSIRACPRTKKELGIWFDGDLKKLRKKEQKKSEPKKYGWWFE